MRKYIGNVTTYTEQQKESAPAREAQRLALIRKIRIDKAVREGKNHFEEIFGRRDIIKESLLAMFDDDGNPPPHITIEDIARQYRRLAGQLRWITAILEELYERMEFLDMERFAAEKAEWEQREKDESDRKEQIYAEFMKNKQRDPYPNLRKAIREAMQASRRAAEVRKLVKREVTDVRIMEVRQLETALRYMFAEYVKNPAYAVTQDPVVQYNFMRKEADWLRLTSAEIDSKLGTFLELLDAAEMYLDED